MTGFSAKVSYNTKNVMNKTLVFTFLVDTVCCVTFPLKNWKQAPSVSDFANLIIWCSSNLANMGVREQKSDLAVWTSYFEKGATFFSRVIVKNNNNNKQSLACIVFSNRMI